MTPKAETWDPDRVKRLRELYGTTADADLAAELGLDEESIKKKASELALAKDKRHFKGRAMPRWSVEALDTLRREYPKRPNLELARLLGRSLKSVNSKASTLGLKKDLDRLEAMGRENVAQRRKGRAPRRGKA